MLGGHFNRYLMQDKEEAEQLRLAREIEEEKAMYSVIILCLSKKISLSVQIYLCIVSLLVNCVIKSNKFCISKKTLIYS